MVKISFLKFKKELLNLKFNSFKDKLDLVKYFYKYYLPWLFILGIIWIICSIYVYIINKSFEIFLFFILLPIIFNVLLSLISISFCESKIVFFEDGFKITATELLNFGIFLGRGYRYDTFNYFKIKENNLKLWSNDKSYIMSEIEIFNLNKVQLNNIKKILSKKGLMEV